MAGNTFGKLFSVTTFGESHGVALGGVVEGCPPGLPLEEADIQQKLARRRPGQSRYTSQRKELDQIQILSGVFEGVTTGTPIGFLIHNTDAHSQDYEKIKSVFRPGHADYTYQKKYGVRDYRGGGRASARETVARVAAGAIAQHYLKTQWDIEIRACVTQIGALLLPIFSWDSVNDNPFFCADRHKVPEIEVLIQSLLREGDSVGAKIYVEALNVPAGLGDPVFDKLEAVIAQAMMSIPAVKATGVGDGFACVAQRGSEYRDELTPTGFLSNRAGGMLGGISTGQAITAEVAFKPTSSIRVPGKTVTVENEAAEIVTTGRHDPCVGLRAVPIVEAMLALVLADFILRWRAYV